MERKDKKLYCYKQALSQPIWIQKFNERFSLNSPIKFSRIIYFVIVFLLGWFLFGLFLPFLSFGYKGMVSAFGAIWLSSFFSETVVDGKPFASYIRDYLAYYFTYGIQSEKIYINKGKVYKQPAKQKKKGDL